MAKTKPIGVRFDTLILDVLEEYGVKTPQQALNWLFDFYQNSVASKGPEEKQRTIPDKEHKPIETLKEKARRLCPENLTGLMRTSWINEYIAKRS